MRGAKIGNRSGISPINIDTIRATRDISRLSDALAGAVLIMNYQSFRIDARMRRRGVSGCHLS